jgi:hypothetical protein
MQVMDDDKRENEGDLIMAAEFVTAQQCAFMKAYTNGEAKLNFGVQHISWLLSSDAPVTIRPLSCTHMDTHTHTHTDTLALHLSSPFHIDTSLLDALVLHCTCLSSQGFCVRQ